MSARSIKGFTLVELLVVMVILGILGTIGFAIFTSSQQKARTAKIEGDIKMIKKMMVQATVGGRRLRDITGSTCTICGCLYSDGVTDMTDPGQTVSCIGGLTENWNKILNAAGYPDDATPLPKDPYGSYYGWDENEGEVDSGWNPTGCEVRDYILVAGPNRSFQEPVSNDDIQSWIPPSVCN